MKKIIAYIAVLAAFAAVSCNRTEVDFQPINSSVLSISLSTGEMATRASAIPAVEETVSEFDWFFYADATGTSAPVYHGHFNVASGTSGATLTPSGTNTPDEYNADTDGVIHLGFDIEHNYTDLGISYYVYVLANYSGIDHSNAAELTVNKLLAKTMETNFDEKSSSYEAINNFVMDSDSGDDKAAIPQLVPLLSAVADASNKTQAHLAVKLRRVAAKISFTLNISEQIEDPQNANVTDESLKTYWRPLTTSPNYTAYMVNAIGYATVAGTAQNAEDMAPTFINGNSGITGGHQISYATSHVKTATDTHNPPLVWKLDPFYTYPVEFDSKSNNAPYLKIALPWENVDAEGNLTNKGATLYYYKAYLMDAETRKPLTKFERNTHYIVTLNVDTIGGTQEDYVTLDTFYYVADWQVPADGTYTGYSAPRYLDIARPVYYIYGDNDLTVAVTSSHTIEPVIMSVNQKTLYGADKMTSIPASAHVTGDGKVSFTLEYALNTVLDSKNMDLTPITWEIRVYHAEDHSVYKDVTIIQYPSIYGEFNYTDDWRSRFVNSVRGNAPTYQSGHEGDDAYIQDGTQTTVYNNHGSGSNTNLLGAVGQYKGKSYNKTVLTISTLASVSSFGWILGDPRVRLEESGLYNAVINGSTWAQDDLGTAPDYLDDYLVAIPANAHYIAPKIMFTSGYAADGSHSSEHWKNAAERCAAYQEDGYPAGRWRLPTEAEIEFSILLQVYGYVDNANVVFHPDHSYWSASGRYYSGTNKRFTTPGTGIPSNVSNRCVYDLWYWGDEPYNDNGVQIKEGVTPNTPAITWLGFMTD